MKVLISEALRLKNDISNLIGSLQRSFTYGNSIIYGITTENGKEVTTQEDSIQFDDAFNDLETLLNYSLELNDKMALFNVGKYWDSLDVEYADTPITNNISSIVRQIKNNDVLKERLNHALTQAKKTSRTNYQIVGNTREAVVSEYTPIVDKKQTMDLIKIINNKNRQLQSLLDKLNAMEIDVSFSYDDIEELKNKYAI